MPSIDVGPSGDVVDVGTTIELSCSYAEGVPPPRFTWITDANTTTIKGWTMIQDIVHKKSRLIVTDKAEPVHAGNYTCVVVNRFGSVSSKPARIFVRCKIRFVGPRLGTFCEDVLLFFRSVCFYASLVADDCGSRGRASDCHVHRGGLSGPYGIQRHARWEKSLRCRAKGYESGARSHCLSIRIRREERIKWPLLVQC